MFVLGSKVKKTPMCKIQKSKKHQWSIRCFRYPAFVQSCIEGLGVHPIRFFCAESSANHVFSGLGFSQGETSELLYFFVLLGTSSYFSVLLGTSSYFLYFRSTEVRLFPLEYASDNRGTCLFR